MSPRHIPSRISTISTANGDHSTSTGCLNDLHLPSDTFAACVLLELAGDKMNSETNENPVSKSEHCSTLPMPNGIVRQNTCEGSQSFSFVNDHKIDLESNSCSSSEQGISPDLPTMNGELDACTTQNCAANCEDSSKCPLNPPEDVGNTSTDRLTNENHLCTRRQLRQSSPEGEAMEHDSHLDVEVIEDDKQKTNHLNGNSGAGLVACEDSSAISNGGSDPVCKIECNGTRSCAQKEAPKKEYNELEEGNDEERDSELEVVDNDPSEFVAYSPVKMEATSEESDMELEVGGPLTSFKPGFGKRWLLL